MELTRLACFRPLREKMVTRTVWHLIDNPNYSASLLKLFVSSFLSFDDVQFMTLKGIRFDEGFLEPSHVLCLLEK